MKKLLVRHHKYCQKKTKNITKLKDKRINVLNENSSKIYFFSLQRNLEIFSDFLIINN